MHCVQNITQDILYLGVSDRRLALFENVFPIPRGVSYNTYLVKDEKNVLMDTADQAVGDRFLENLAFGLEGRSLDYVVVNHMEPDHTATLMEVLKTYPQAQVVGNAKTIAMIGQFFDCDISDRAVTVKEGDTLNTGRHTFTFLMAPMVHWPEVMVDRVVDGVEAVDKMTACEDGYYDMIFMDIQMPRMNGYDAARAIRAMDRNYCRQIPIIAMTANAFAEDVHAAKTVGMNEHIAKPLDLDTLARVLKKWM